eukprot:4577847-Karenia_brevis.AAC.1
MDLEVWEKTLQDAEAKSLIGPFSADEIKDRVGSLWVGAFRFGIKQSGKVRPIDDFSQFLQNLTVGKTEKVTMMSLDDVVARARAWAE